MIIPVGGNNLGIVPDTNMANRRMMSKDVIDTDNFLDMSLSTQALYFHLLLKADDDGFVKNPKRIMRMIGANDDEMKVLISKKYIFPFESGVCVIKHWRIHNYIQNDRYKETNCTEEKKQLGKNKNSEYYLKSEENDDMDTLCIQDVSTGKDRIGKDRLDNVSKETEQSSYGREDINEVIGYLKEKIELLDGSQQQNRRFAKLLIDKLKKEYPDYNPVEQIKVLIDIALKDDFHAKNATSIKYFYYNAQKIIQSIKKPKKGMIKSL